MAMAWMRSIVHTVPSFNDLNTVPEEKMAGIHHDMPPQGDSTAMRDVAPVASAMVQKTRSMTNKMDDYPATEVVDYHKINRFVPQKEKHKLYDNPMPSHEGKPHSVWEMIIKSEEYMKGGKDQSKTPEPSIPTSVDADMPKPEPIMHAQSAPSIVMPSVTQPTRMMPPESKVADKPSMMVNQMDTTPATSVDAKVAGIKDMLEHYGSD